MNETIKKADMHYVGFIDTCMQMGIEKDAADRLYKEAFPKFLTGIFSKFKPSTVGKVTRIKPGQLGSGLAASGALKTPVKPGQLAPGLATNGVLTGPGIPPVPKRWVIKPTVRQAPPPPGSFLEWENNNFSFINDPLLRRKASAGVWSRMRDIEKARATAAARSATPASAVQPPVKRLHPRILDDENAWNTYFRDVPTGAPAAGAGATAATNAARAAEAQLMPYQQNMLDSISDPVRKASLKARFLEINARRAPIRAPGSVQPGPPTRLDLRATAGGRERMMKYHENMLRYQTAKLRRSLSGGTTGAEGAGNAAAGLESAADTVPAAGNYLPWLALGGGLGAGLVGYGLVSNSSAA
jgi:hypothetical protein